MKTKLYSNKQLMKDNVQLTKELNRCIQSNMELKLLYESMHDDVDKINNKISNLNEFIKDNYSDFWINYKQWNRNEN